MSQIKCAKFKVGQVWINNSEYKIKILDVGDEQLWCLWENGHKGSWRINDFLELYTIWEDVK